MLQQICEEIHNFFISDARVGTYEVTGGRITLDWLKEGQRFWIVGSDLNDGVYTYHQSGIKNDDDKTAVTMPDEVFGGTVCAMAVPRGVIEIAEEIGVWNTAYAESVNSPYQSETFNGYSYTKASGSGGKGADPATWQGHFASRLNAWRKAAL